MNDNEFLNQSAANVATSPSLRLHDEAVSKARLYRRAEAELLEVLTRVAGGRLYLQFELTSLYSYCVDLLELPTHTAYDFINVVRMAAEIPAVAEAIYSGRTTVSKMRKVSSVITTKNSKEWIDLAVHCSARVIEKAVAQANPRAAVKESLKYIAGDVLLLNLAVSETWAELLASTKDRLSQEKRRAVSTEEALFSVMQESHERNDPVKKAERSQRRRIKTAIIAVGQEAVSEADQNCDRAPRQGSLAHRRSRLIPARARHEVKLRDGVQCTHRNSSGNRCNNRRWTDLHHIIGFADGGSHEPENLRTLCSAHHRLQHAH